MFDYSRKPVKWQVGNFSELKSSCGIKSVGSFEQTDVALVHQIGQSHALSLVLLGYRDDKAQIGTDEFFSCLVSLCSALADGLGQLLLSLWCDEWNARDVFQVSVKSRRCS